MREMKDSGIDWIGEIPSNWDIKPIKRNYKIISGATPKSNNEENWGGDITWITPADFKASGKYIATGRKNITEKGYNSCSTTIVPTNSIIFSKRAPVGTVAINSNELCTNQGCLSCVPFKEMNSSFGYYSMLAGKCIFEISAQGTTFMEISANDFANIKLPIAPLEEQEEIAKFLDVKCAAIDQAIQKQKDIVNKLMEYKQSVITHTVTKGLNVKEKDMINSSLPNKWQYRKIKTVVLGLTDGTHGTFERVTKGEPLLSAKNVFDEGLNITDSESMISEEDYRKITANGFPHKGDVLLCCVGTVGRTTIYPYERPLAFQRSVIFMTPNTNIITSKMLNYALMSNDVYNQESLLINQAAQAGLYQGAVREIYIAVPPLEIQDEITAFLDSKCSKINESIERSNKIIQKLEEYKKALIYNAVTGKIDCKNA